MNVVTRELLRTPNRLTVPYAKALVGLALVTLLWTLVGLVTYAGWPRVVHVLAIGSISLGNLCWGMGSLLPEDDGGLTLRQWARPFFLVMVLSLPLALFFVLRGE